MGKSQSASGAVLAELTDYDNALDHLKKASDFYEEHGKAEEFATCLITTALLLKDLGQRHEASLLISRASSCFKQAGKVGDAIHCDEVLIKIIGGVKNYDDGLQMIESLQSQLGQTLPAFKSVISDLTLAAFGHRQWDHVLQSLKELRKDCVGNSMKVESLKLDLIIVDLSIDLGLLDGARTLLDEIDGHPCHTPKSKWSETQLRGRLAARHGEIKEASELYERAIELIEINRERQYRDDTRRKHLESVWPNYDDAIRFFFHQGESFKALEYIERLRVVCLLTSWLGMSSAMLKCSQFRLTKSCPCGQRNSPHRTLPINNGYDSLRDPQGCTIIVTSIFIDGYGLKQCADDFRIVKNARSPEESQSSLDQLLSRLNEFIYSRIQPFLHNIKHIIFCPYSLFHFLPFHAMYSTADGQRVYLQEDKLVTYAPSTRILRNAETERETSPGT